MNRAERRRIEREQGKKKTEKTYTLTQSQIDQIKIDATLKASDTAFLLMLAIPVMVLHDKWWEKTSSKRCPKFVDQCLDLYDSFEKGYVTLDDLEKCLIEESGIRLERSEDPVKYY